MSEDPNKVRNDPMVPEYWLLGEDLQDKIRAAGYDSPTVDGIAVDFHDLLQASKRIEQDLVTAIVATSTEEREQLVRQLEELKFEFEHIRWHCESARVYLDRAIRQLESS